MPSITVENLKAHLNLTEDADDDLLADKIKAADAWVAAFTGAALTDASPEPLKEAVRRIAADLYENREVSLVGVTAQALPFGVVDLITPYRAWAF